MQGRYKAILVEMDAYAQELSRYIHLNPVRAGVVKMPDEYSWSSYRYYIRADRKPAWLQTKFILNYFNKDITRAQKEYRRFVEALGGKDYESPLNNVVGSTILGNDDFINNIKEKHLKTKRTDRDVPALKEFAERPAIGQIAAEVAMMLENEPSSSRMVKLYLCHRYTEKRLK